MDRFLINKAIKELKLLIKKTSDEQEKKLLEEELNEYLNYRKEIIDSKGGIYNDRS